MVTSAVNGDDLLGLLGLSADSASVQAALIQLAHRMEPELDPHDDTSYRDLHKEVANACLCNASRFSAAEGL